MEFFEKGGIVFRNVPAGGFGGGVTGSVVVKASVQEAEAYYAGLAAQPMDEPADELSLETAQQESPAAPEHPSDE